LKIDDSVAVLELNNKKTLNALTTEMIIKLSFILDKLNKSKKIKVVIITSNLEKVFCAGADIKNLNDVKTLNRMLDSDFDLMRRVLFKF
jgi:enoyl-CoA hydratase